MKLIGGNRTLPLPPPPPPRPVISSDVANDFVTFCTRFGLTGWIVESVDQGYCDAVVETCLTICLAFEDLSTSH